MVDSQGKRIRLEGTPFGRRYAFLMIDAVARGRQVPAFLPDLGGPGHLQDGGSWSGPLCGVPNVKKPQATGGHTFRGLLRVHF